ncbi:hypothetical protein ABZ686_01090 [Streptomyces sp. NPDC006992]|uniref:hypothetical protein n=1 Tax=unclassified Streptomyces TaxID=2593676 RepID=UPI0034085714
MKFLPTGEPLARLSLRVGTGFHGSGRVVLVIPRSGHPDELRQTHRIAGTDTNSRARHHRLGYD